LRQCTSFPFRHSIKSRNLILTPFRILTKETEAPLLAYHFLWFLLSSSLLVLFEKKKQSPRRVRLLVDAIQTCYFVLLLFICFQFKGDISEDDRTLFQHLSFLERHFYTSGFLWGIAWLLFRLRSGEFRFLIFLHGLRNEHKENQSGHIFVITKRWWFSLFLLTFIIHFFVVLLKFYNIIDYIALKCGKKS